MAKVVIDAGHGGNDPGASGNGIIEKEYTLKISQYIYDRLRQLGLDVKMTRTTDETLSPTERVNRVLNRSGKWSIGTLDSVTNDEFTAGIRPAVLVSRAHLSKQVPDKIEL